MIISLRRAPQVILILRLLTVITVSYFYTEIAVLHTNSKLNESLVKSKF